MPKVSEEHLERRRRQILDAARVCFVRKGFHETSMQDIFAESGLSAGAVYRYFKSKNDLIEAIAADSMRRVAATMSEVVYADPLPPLDQVVGQITGALQQFGYGESVTLHMGPQVWSLALHDAHTRTVVHDTMSRIRGVWRDYAEGMRQVGRLRPDADVDAVAKVLFNLMPGFIVQFLLVGDVDSEQMRKGMRALLDGLGAS